MKAVLYVDRSNFIFYGSNVHTAATLQPPQTAYSDMEVIDSDALQTLITDFLTKNKIQPSSLVLFFSSQNCFSKDFPKTLKDEEFTAQKNSFVEYVPFNKVLEHTYSIKKDSQTVVVINKELAYVLRDIFLKHGFTIELIVPSFVLFGDQNSSPTEQILRSILQHASSLAKMGYPVVEVEPEVKTADQFEYHEKKESKTRLYAMIGFFAILLGVLAYMLFFYQRPSPAKKTAAPVNRPLSPTLAPKGAPSPTQEIPSEIPDTPKSALSIRVLNGSGVPGQADTIREELLEAGYPNVEVGNAPTQESKNILVAVKPDLEQSHRQEISTLLTSLGFAYSFTESSDLDVDMLITTKKIPE